MDKVIPTLVNGRGLTTTITLTNLDKRSTDVSVFFFALDGSDLSLPIQQLDGNNFSGIKGPLPAGGTVVLSTTGQGDSIQQGWALIAPSVTNAQITAFITITDQLDGRSITEATYRLTSIAETRFRVPLSPNTGFANGVFLVHPDAPSSPVATITAVARDSSGKALSTKQTTLQPLASAFLDFSDLFPGLANMAVVDISSTSRALSAIGARLSPDARVTLVDVLSLPLDDTAPSRPSGTVVSGAAPSSCAQVMGLLIFGDDGKFLGKVSADEYDSQSIANTYGAYGSTYSSTSIFNEFGQYGGQFSTLSAFNDLALRPPVLVSGTRTVAYLTTNSTKSPRVDTIALLGCIGRR